MKEVKTIIDEEVIAQNPDYLIISGNEFRFIRKSCRIKTTEFTIDNLNVSQSTLSRIENQEFVNPYIVFDFIKGMPIGLFEVLRKRYMEIKDKKH